MNEANKHTDLYCLYVFRLLYAVLRPVKLKYNLTVNGLLILNSCYLYTKLERKEFTANGIRLFNRYYNDNRIKFYFTGLLDRGLIYIVNPDKKPVKYSISDLGVKAIEEIEQYYNIELSEFCTKYNIDL